MLIDSRPRCLPCPFCRAKDGGGSQVISPRSKAAAMAGSREDPPGPRLLVGEAAEVAVEQGGALG